MAKRGFFKIGYITNSHDYPEQIKTKAGIAWYDFEKFNSTIEEKWAQQQVLCFDSDLSQVEANEPIVRFIMIDINYEAEETGEPLYGGFWSTKDFPQSLKNGDWTGVQIGTKAELLEHFEELRAANVSEPPDLWKWAFIPDHLLEKLGNAESGMALPESWHFGKEFASGGRPVDRYPILWNYLNNTFKKLWRDGHDEHIPRVSGHAAFNTGLVDWKYDPIFALFVENQKPDKQPWFLRAFAIPGEDEFGKLLTELFNPLPPRADYFSRGIESVIFDPKSGVLSIDWTHILTEHCERYPIAFFEENCPHGFTVIDGKDINEAAQEPDAALRADYFKKLGEKIASDNRVFRRLRNRVDDAVELAKRRAEWNYKTAVPVYNPKTNQSLLLLPLSVMDEDAVDLALLVERHENGNYTGHTILSLDMAYTNSRLITRPDSDWLCSDQIAAPFDEAKVEFE